MENKQLLPFHPISQEEQQKSKTLLACYILISVFGATAINTHHKVWRKKCVHVRTPEMVHLLVREEIS